jgi:hypothetical protein
VPFLRFSRDKRGYEHTYLIHELGGRGRPARARVLYWFRTPPGVRVGRDPFDEEARRQIESHNPGLFFDWNAIVSTPIPPVPEVEHWRERRRVERAAKVARREEEKEVEAVDARTEALETAAVPEPLEPSEAAELPAPFAEKTFTIVQGSSVTGQADQARKRRRRRGGKPRAAAPFGSPHRPVSGHDAGPSQFGAGIASTEGPEPGASDRNVEPRPSTPGPSEPLSGTSEE